MIAVGVNMIKRVTDHQYELGFTSQGQIYLMFVLQLVAPTPLKIFN